jgi:hypothetical protein
MRTKSSLILPIDRITSRIYLIRKEKVLLDSDLAELYKVQTKVLLQSVKRNKTRFPPDFMFQLSKHEFQVLRSQIVTSSWGGSRYLPRAFTEQGVAMLSSVLKSDWAVQVNIAIMRAFVQMRKFLLSNEELAKKLKNLDEEMKNGLAKQQQKINYILRAIDELMEEEEKPKRRIGF